MKSLPIILSVFALFLAPIAAQDDAAGLAKGDQLIQNLQPEQAGSAAPVQTFEAFLGENSVGYGILSMTLRKGATGMVYDYSHEVGLRMSDGTVIRGVIAGVLSPSFTPLSIRTERKATSKDGAAHTFSTELQVQGQQVTISSNENGKKTESKAALPAGTTIVFGIEALVGRLVVACQDSFAVRELQPDSGALKTVTLSTIAMPDGSFRVGASRDGRNVDVSFLISKTGSLLEFGDPNSEYAERPCTAQRLEELKALLAK